MQPDFDSRGVTRPLSAFLRLAMMGCPALRAHGELVAGACAPVLNGNCALRQHLVLGHGGDETLTTKEIG